MKLLETLKLFRPDYGAEYFAKEQTLINALFPLLSQVNKNFAWPIAPFRITSSDSREVYRTQEYNRHGDAWRSDGVLLSRPITQREGEIAQIYVRQYPEIGDLSEHVIYQAHLTLNSVGTTRKIFSNNYSEPTKGMERNEIVMALLSELQNRGLSIDKLGSE